MMRARTSATLTSVTSVFFISAMVETATAGGEALIDAE